MEFCIAQEKDRDAIEWLWDYCFEKREDAFFRWFFSKHYKSENVLAGYQNGCITSCLHLLPYQLFLRGTALPASYIVGLATFPEARRGGGVRRLLQAALQEMRNRGQHVNILMPSKAGFYYPYQWEFCHHHFKYTVPLEDLRNMAISGGEFYLVQGGAANCTDLQTVYEIFMSDKHGYAIRDEYYWQRIIEEHTATKGFAYLLEFNGYPAGYVFYYVQGDKLTVREMAWTCTTAQQALFQFLYNHRSQAMLLEWNAPIDDITYLRLPNPKQQVLLSPFMMGRVVDVASALTAITYPRELALQTVLQIQDELAPWNNQMMVLEISDGRGHVEFCEKGKAEFQCDIGTFSQLFFGRVSAKKMQKSDRLHINFPGNVAKLDMLFPPCDNYINEYY